LAALVTEGPSNSALVEREAQPLTIGAQVAVSVTSALLNASIVLDVAAGFKKREPEPIIGLDIAIQIESQITASVNAILASFGVSAHWIGSPSQEA